jgi:DNA-binding MarR family transcriptional regulator
MPEATVTKSKEVLRVWLRMLSTTMLVEGQLKRRMRAQFGMTLAQFDLMAALARGEESRTMTDISRMLMVSNGNVTGLVDRLANEGLVAREPCEDDRRVYRIALTKEGRRRFQEMAEQHEAWLSELFEGVDMATVATLGKTLKTLKEHLAQENGVGEADG